MHVASMIIIIIIIDSYYQAQRISSSMQTPEKQFADKHDILSSLPLRDGETIRSEDINHEGSDEMKRKPVAE
jgi:hypothetical protein